MQVISTLDALDAKLAECDAAVKISDDALRQVFTTFRMDFATEVPADPFSPEYHEFQMAVYRRISGRNYSPQNEISAFDAITADRRPFPFYTGSCRTVGYFTMGMGYLLQSLNLPAGARIVEFGPGWGNTTIAMAMTGLDVTAVDIEANFCELLRLRAKRHEVNLTVVQADFMWAETVSEPFDAAVFFECFHHCSDHLRLLRALQTAVKPDGRVYFAAEPIVPDFPVPWGIRLDGESLWAIRANGWMELGYRDTYFREALDRTGWIAVRHTLPGLEWASVWEARKRDGFRIFVAASDSRLRLGLGIRRDDRIVFSHSGPGIGLFGPYIDLPRGQYLARLQFAHDSTVEGRAHFDVSADVGQRILAVGPLKPAPVTQFVTLGDSQAQPSADRIKMAADLRFEVADDVAQGVETRIHCDTDFSAVIAGVEIILVK